MSIKDGLGQDISIGDIVVYRNDSSLSYLHVITRHGSGTKVQMDGGSYTDNNYVLVITDLAVKLKGQSYVDNLRAKYADKMNTKKVDSKDSTRFVVWTDKYYDDDKNGIAPRIYITPVTGLKSTWGQQVYAHVQQLDVRRPQKYLEVYNTTEYRKAPATGYDRVEKIRWVSRQAESISLKSINKLGLQAFVGTEVVGDSADVLKAFDSFRGYY